MNFLQRHGNTLILVFAMLIGASLTNFALGGGPSVGGGGEASITTTAPLSGLGTLSSPATCTDASASVGGCLTASTQSIVGAKTFTTSVASPSFIGTSTSVITPALSIPTGGVLCLNGPNCNVVATGFIRGTTTTSMEFGINGATELTLTSTALTPTNSGGNSLGTAALPWLEANTSGGMNNTGGTGTTSTNVAQGGYFGLQGDIDYDSTGTSLRCSGGFQFLINNAGHADYVFDATGLWVNGVARSLAKSGSPFTNGFLGGTLLIATGSGSNSISMTANGSRLDLGDGASDYASSDGTTVTWAGPLASASTMSATTYTATSSLFTGLGSTSVTSLSSNINAATATNTIPAISLAALNALDANDLLFNVQDQSTARFTVDKEGDTSVGGNLVVIGGTIDCNGAGCAQSCTLDGASPSKCTVTVPASSKCVCSRVGTTAAIAATGCAVSLSGTTLTITSADGAATVVNALCLK